MDGMIDLTFVIANGVLRREAISPMAVEELISVSVLEMIGKS
jgi:hypothetical protein